MKKAGIIPLTTFRSADLPLKVQPISDHLQDQSGSNEGLHSHNYYEMIWVTKGSGALHADMQDFTIGSNTFFCLKPDLVHQFQQDVRTITLKIKRRRGCSVERDFRQSLTSPIFGEASFARIQAKQEGRDLPHHSIRRTSLGTLQDGNSRNYWRKKSGRHANNFINRLVSQKQRLAVFMKLPIKNTI